MKKYIMFVNGYPSEEVTEKEMDFIKSQPDFDKNLVDFKENIKD